MTAANIAQELGLEAIEIDSLSCEFLSGMMFESNPIPELELYKLGDTNLTLKYGLNVKIDSISDIYRDQSFKIYPESKERAMCRSFISSDKAIAEHMSYSFQNQTNLCVLTITHALTVGWQAKLNEIMAA